MAEYWKSTPKYICKYCDVYVRDTKLERTNHEATGRHQGAVKRFLRNLHRTAAEEDREKERARREIDRLNGVTSTPNSDAQQVQPERSGAYAKPDEPAVVSASERRARMEQLAELGVSIPSEFRGDLALVGEWSTTSEKVIRRKINPTTGEALPEGDDAGGKKRGQADEDEEEEEAAIQSLFKRPKTARWGRDSRRSGEVDDEADLDALLSAVTSVKKGDEEAKPDSDDIQASVKAEEGEVKTEEDKVKQEDADIKTEDGAGQTPLVKPEDATEDTKLSLDSIPSQVGEAGGAGGVPGTGAVVFKKRKAKNIRQK